MLAAVGVIHRGIEIQTVAYFVVGGMSRNLMVPGTGKHYFVG